MMHPNNIYLSSKKLTWRTHQTQHCSSSNRGLLIVFKLKQNHTERKKKIDYYSKWYIETFGNPRAEVESVALGVSPCITNNVSPSL